LPKKGQTCLSGIRVPFVFVSAADIKRGCKEIAASSGISRIAGTV